MPKFDNPFSAAW